MNNGIFRESSVKRVTSPEQLGDYIRVSNPSVWMALAAVIILLAGVCIWGIFGRLETTVSAPAVVKDGRAVCYVGEKAVASIKAGMAVTVDGKECKVTSVSATPTQIDETFDSYALHIGGFGVGEWVYTVTVDAAIPDGTYKAEIVTDSASPMSFVFN